MKERERERRIEHVSFRQWPNVAAANEMVSRAPRRQLWHATIYIIYIVLLRACVHVDLLFVQAILLALVALWRNCHFVIENPSQSLATWMLTKLARMMHACMLKFDYM